MNKKVLKLSSYLENHLLTCLIGMKTFLLEGCSIKSYLTSQEHSCFLNDRIIYYSFLG